MYFPKLTTLHIQNGFIEEISKMPDMDLRNLQKLSLENNRIR